jgi:arylsulfatase A-like enzyme
MASRLMKPCPVKSLLFPPVLLLAVLFSAAPGRSETKPNFLVILADDLGYQDVGFQGSPEIRTPHIDSIAAGGMRFTDGYVSGPMCSPTRAGLLTGRYGSHIGHEINYDPYEKEPGTLGLPLTEKTLADLLKPAGYVSGIVGKWHLGQGPAYLPLQRGFDEFFGFPSGNHSFLKAQGDRGNTYALTGWEGKPFEFAPGEGYLTEILGEQAGAFLRRHKDRPWFLYLAFNAPHTPMEATTKYLERFPGITKEPRKTYAAMISAMDDAVGAILKTLEETGQGGRTLVVFLSDNGGPTKVNDSCNAPLSGGKGMVLEGGVRVPFAAKFPGVIAPGSVYQRPVISIDLAPTFLELAGLPMPGENGFDGKSLVPVFRGAQEGDLHGALYWRMRAREIWAVRRGDYKLVMQEGAAPRLIDLSKDIAEANDLSAAQPEVFQEMKALFDQWSASMPEPLWGAERGTVEPRKRNTSPGGGPGS